MQLYLTISATTAVLLSATLAAQAVQAQPHPPPQPANCRNTGSFEPWLDGFRKEAIANGISRKTVTAALDVAVLPSYREAQGLTVLEAMALSRPVVA